MSKAKVSPLSAGLIAKKGQATPAGEGSAAWPMPPVVPGEAPPPSPVPPVVPGDPAPVSPEAKEAAPSPDETGYYKALTVKLNRARYEKLKMLGLRLDKKSQAIFEAALDDYLAKHADTIA